MINKNFEIKLFNAIQENELTKKRQLKASELYLEKGLKLIFEKENELRYIVNGKNITILLKGNELVFFIEDTISIMDEYVLACLLNHKRRVYINSSYEFKIEDLQLNAYYYNNFFVSNITFEDYQIKFNFYFGIIDMLYELEMYEECLELMVKLFCVLENKFIYDKKYSEQEKYNLFRVIKNKKELIIERIDHVLEVFKSLNYPFKTLGKLIYIMIVNYPLSLSNQKLKIVYEFLFNNYNNVQKGTQFYSDLQTQYNIVCWYNNELDNSYMEKNINAYEVMYCYVNYLFAKKEYQKITTLFSGKNFYFVHNDIINQVLYSYYYCQKYEDAIDILKSIRNLTFELYKQYKQELPLLFTKINVENIIEIITENTKDDELKKILQYEKVEDYQTYMLTKQDFNSIDQNFNEYVGKYDKQLIKIYQKEIINNINSLRGYYNHIPEIIIEKFEKLKKVKNGKYYICELIREVLDNKYSSFSEELEKYCKELEV